MPPRTKLPGYWLPSEIAEKLKKSPKWVLHRINGRDGRAPDLFAYQVKRLYFIPDDHAIAFIEKHGGEI